MVLGFAVSSRCVGATAFVGSSFGFFATICFTGLALVFTMATCRASISSSVSTRSPGCVSVYARARTILSLPFIVAAPRNFARLVIPLDDGMICSTVDFVMSDVAVLTLPSGFRRSISLIERVWTLGAGVGCVLATFSRVGGLAYTVCVAFTLSVIRFSNICTIAWNLFS